MICIDYLIIIIIIDYYNMLLFFMTRRKCKENYEVENGELYFRKSERGSKKGPETECNDVWKKIHLFIS